MSTIVAGELPVAVKRWFEGWLEQKLKSTDKIMVMVSTPNESKEFSQHYEAMQKRSHNRLKAVAQKMQKAGLGENEVYYALHGGLKENESFFFRPKTKKRKRATK